MPLVSLLLCVYNGEEYIRDTLDSIVAQTYQNWELVVIDDCSSDTTPEGEKPCPGRRPGEPPHKGQVTGSWGDGI